MCAADILWWYLITDFIKVYMQGVYQKLLAMYVPVLVGLYNINWKESNNNLWHRHACFKNDVSLYTGIIFKLQRKAIRKNMMLLSRQLL